MRSFARAQDDKAGTGGFSPGSRSLERTSPVPAVFEQGEAVAPLLLPTDVRDERLGIEVGAELDEDGEAATDVGVGLGEVDRHGAAGIG